MPGAGPAILFVITLAATAAVTAVVLAYAARCYLVVVQETAAGLDRVKWPDEPFQDWLLRSVPLVGLGVLAVAPAGMLSRALRHDWLPNDPGLRFLLLAVPGLWLLFPPVLLLVLGRMSHSAPAGAGALLGLLRLVPHVACFYLFTALLLAASAALWHRALFTSSVYILPLAGALGGAVVLVHARLLGRVAWLAQQLQGEKARPAKARRRRAPTKRRAKKTRALEVQDPWAVPKKGAQEPDVPRLPVEGYGLAAEAPPEKPARRKKVDLPVEGYEVAEEGPSPTPKNDPREPAVSAAALEREVELRDRTPADAPPAWPLFSGVCSFPFYEGSLKAWLWLSLGGVAIGVGVRALIAYYPV
jgi:hypothetical protein